MGCESFVDLSPCDAKLEPTLQSKRKRPKAQVATLCRLWAQVCLRENQARIRNEQLLQDFSALEAQLEDLSARTSALWRRKRDYEEFLQHLKRDLQKTKGPDERQGWVSDRPLEHFMRPQSTNWDVPPFETAYQRESLPLPHKERTPCGADPGKLWPGFGEPEQNWSPSMAPSFHSQNTSSQTSRKHGNQALWSPWKSQKDRESCLSFGQGIEASVVRRGLPQGWLKPGMAEGPEDFMSKSLIESNIMNQATRSSVLCSQRSGEEHDEILARRRKGHNLANTPEAIAQFHGELPAPHGLPRTFLSEDGSDSLGSLAEGDSEPWGTERKSRSSARQHGMRSKHQDANQQILSEELTQVPLKRSPGLLKGRENVIDEGGNKKIWEQQEGAFCWEVQGDGDLQEKQGQEKATSNEIKNGDAAGNSDLGQEQTEIEALEKETTWEEAGILEGGSREGNEGLEPGRGEQEGNAAADEAMTKEGNHLDSLGPASVEENGSLCTEPEIQVGNGLEGEGGQEGRNVEGEAVSEEEKGTSSKHDEEPIEAEGGQNGSCEKEAGPEGDLGSQTRAGGPEDDAASTSSGSVQMPWAPMNCGTAQLVQNESPVEARLAWTDTESICEGEEEEEREDTEANTDIEAALAPCTYKPGSKHLQGEAGTRRLQELWADAEEAEDGNLDNEDDFYD